MDPEVGVYFVGFTVVEWLSVFIDENACKIITDNLNFVMRKFPADQCPCDHA